MPVVGWFASDAGLFVGAGSRFRSRWWSPRRDLSLSMEQRVRHMYVVGSSGSGKSRLARYLIGQDVDRNRGFTLVDPHHDLHCEVLGQIAELALGPGKPTAERIEQLGDKLVILEPADQRYGAPGINLLQVGPGQVPYQLVDSIIEVIRELWPDNFGPRLEDICRNALLLLQELGLTVLEIIPLLSDAGFRSALVARSQNPEVRLYFEQHLGGLRATHPQRVWRERAQLYAAYADARTGLFRRRFRRQTFRLLIVTTPDYRRRSRRDNILETIRQAIGRTDMFLATTFADVTADRLLGPVWLRADGGAQHCAPVEGARVIVKGPLARAWKEA